MAGGLTPEVRARLEAMGFRPKRRLGQNFMRDGNMLAALARESGAGEGDLVLEPGPGAGGLTAELLDAGCEVVAVELDPLLAAFLRERFAERPGFRLVEGDMLGEGRRVSPDAASALVGREFVVASNLPYSAATPFLLALAGSDLPWRRAAVTVQKEVAERLCASPGGSAYGAATALLRARAECASVRRVPPDVFWPRPKIDSAVLRLTPRPDPDVTAAEFEGFAAFARGLFSARRKKLPRAMAAAGLDAAAAREAIRASGAPEDARPGDLSPAQMAAAWRAGA
ncbi:MAG: 16S rRNA (adenine(1518)-N(6)/adenine(1519)-N(6))-dimethyltransferase RsmA [Planctomycetota bacterium]|jgi:16S rRNA (adenine1518-N6/adenine1519-N6)-dimethyltransferase